MHKVAFLAYAVLFLLDNIFSIIIFFTYILNNVKSLKNSSKLIIFIAFILNQSITFVISYFSVWFFYLLRIGPFDNYRNGFFYFSYALSGFLTLFLGKYIKNDIVRTFLSLLSFRPIFYGSIFSILIFWDTLLHFFYSL